MSCFFENLDEGFGRTPYKMSYSKNKQTNQPQQQTESCCSIKCQR